MPSLSRAPFFPWQCLAGLMVLLLAGCAAESERVFSVRGVVRAPYADGTITIQHETIPDFMPAMTMPFHADAADVKDLTVGDVVEFEFRVGERSRATKFRKLGRAAPDTWRGPAPVPGAEPQRRLRAGDIVPAFTLIDQESRPMTDEDFRGRHTILTFIFTRCPVPEFCPLIARKFQSLQEQLAGTPSNAREETRLLSISIDPEHDRPAVLRSYGESLGADFGRWRFATGTGDQIDTLARLFAVRTERNGATIDHTLATALIGPEGEVVEIWRGNAWKPEEIVARISSSR